MAAGTEFSQLVDQTHDMASNMAKAEKSADGLSGLFRQAAVYAGAYEIIKNAVIKTVERTELYSRFSQSISRDSLSRQKLLERELIIKNELRNVEQDIRAAGGKASELDNRRKLTAEHHLEMLRRQKVVASEIQRVGFASLTLFTAYKAAAFDLYVKTREFNQSLIEANSSFTHRNRLMNDTLMLQAQTGMSFDKIAHSARALVHYGMDTEKTYTDNLRAVTQLEQGLGVSVETSAQLASVVERQLKGSFTAVSDTVAEIVQGTSLAGDEVARLALNIGNAMGRLKPGLGAAGLPDVLRIVGRYEGALKEVSGQAGGVQQFLAHMTSVEGMAGAGVLGVTPEFLATEKGIEQVMERFAAYGNKMIGQSQGWARQQNLASLGQQFGMSADAANQLMLSIKRANEQQTTAISLQDRWREQMHAANTGLSRIANSLWSLLQYAMSPLVIVIGGITNALADFLEMILESKKIVLAVAGVLGVGFVALTNRMWSLGRALWATVVSSTTAQAALVRFNTALAAQAGLQGAAGLGARLFAAPTQIDRWSRLFSGMWQGGFFSGLTRFANVLKLAPTTGSGTLIRPIMLLVRAVGMLMNPLGLIVAGVAVAGYFAHKQYSEIQKLREDARVQSGVINNMAKAYETKQKARFYGAARAGNVAEASAAFNRIAETALRAYSDVEDLDERFKKRSMLIAELADSAKQVTAQATSISSGLLLKNPKDYTQENLKVQAAIHDILINIAKTAESTRKDAEAQKKRDEDENSRERALDRTERKLSNTNLIRFGGR